MNKKTGTRILIVVVAGLWAYNIYRTIQNYQVKQETEELRSSTIANFTPIVFNKDTFQLELADVDPFLKENTTWRKNASRSNTPTSTPPVRSSNTPKKITESPATIIWPKISYYGFVHNRNQDKTLCLLSIDNKMTRLSKGEVNQGLKLIESYHDSVVLELDGKRNVFMKGMPN